MATRVELTTRETLSDILNEVKPPRTLVSPLSDASNKSSDPNISSPIVIEDTARVPSKPVTMFNPGLRLRLSPKPFSKEKPPENRRSIGLISTFSPDVKPHSDVPFQASNSISLSGSAKTDEGERMGRRIYTSSYQPKPEEHQGNKSEFFSTNASRKQTSPSWVPGTSSLSDTKSSSQADERIVISKPPIISRKPDSSHLEKNLDTNSRGNSSFIVDEQNESGHINIKSSLLNPEKLDSSSVRAQLRPKRRPVSMLLDSKNDAANDAKEVEDQRTWNRRPLSEDLTSLFETKGFGSKKDIPSEETKENRPLRKNSLNNSISEDQPVRAKEDNIASNKTIANETRTGISFSRNINSAQMEMKSSRELDVAENEGVMKLSANITNKASKTIPNSKDRITSDVKDTDDSAAPANIQRRISMYLSNTNSVDVPESPTNKEEKTAIIPERNTTSLVSDKEMIKSGRPQTASQSHPGTIDFTKMFSTSPSNTELRSEKTSTEKSGYVSQDYGAQKENTDWRTSELSEEKPLRPRRSIRKVDERLQIEESSNIPKERRYTYKDSKYDTTNDVSEKEPNSDVADRTVKTVKATMFEHKIERHNAAEVYHAGDPLSSYPPRSDASSERSGTKHETTSWSEWLSGDNVHSVSQCSKDHEFSDKIRERSFGKFSSPKEAGNVGDGLHNLNKVDNRRIEPRFEVIQSVGEKVLSESVQMAPEDKATTLRSRRSFHKKDRDQDMLGVEEHFTERPSASSLQRSRSEYIKRRTQDSPQESSSNILFPRDVDVPFEKKIVFRGEKIERTAPAESHYIRERTYLTSKNKSIGDEKLSDFQDKSYIFENKEKRDNTLEKDTLDHPSFGIGTENNKGINRYFGDFNRQPYKSVSDSLEKDLKIPSKPVKDEPSVTNSNVKEIKNTSPVHEVKTQLFNLNRFSSDNEPGALTQKGHTVASNDFINVMLNQEVEQIKKDLTPKPLKEESKEDLKWMRRKASFNARDTSNDGARITSDIFKSELDEERQPTDLKLKSENKDKGSTSTVKAISPIETKATYFAVTCVDNKKQKNNFENLSNSAFHLPSEESLFQGDKRLNTTYTRSYSDYVTNEEKNTKDDFGTLSASKEIKTIRNQKTVEEDLIGKSEKTSERQNVIDIDALLKRHRQKPSLDDKGPTYRESYVKTTQKTYKMESENTQEQSLQDSPLKLDAFYKSKVVDIDSLMADYNANQQKDKENKFRGDDQNLFKWERSRSFRDSVSKGSSTKYNDPPKHVTATEGYQYESVASWYSSRETTSTKGDHKHDPPKSATILDNMHSLAEASREKNQDKGRDDQGIHGHSEKSHNIVSLDSSLESSTRTRGSYKARSTQAMELPTTMADKSTPHMRAKIIQAEMSTNIYTEDAAVVVECESSVKTERKSTAVDERLQLSERRSPRKASDLINLMLENKERRVDQHHTRQRRTVELPQEPRTHRSTNQPERAQWESKEYSDKEELKQRPTKFREMEFETDPFVMKSLNRRRERAMQAEEDHIKQCFSRSSTSNKDTDSIVQEPDRQYGTWSQDKQHTEGSFVRDSPSYDNISSRKQQSHSRLSSLSHTETDQHDSITEARDGSLDRSSMDLDSTDGTESTPSFNEAKAVDFSFVDHTSVLDSTALKNRVQLSRRSQRRAPTQLQRKSRLLQSSSQLAVIEDTDNPWMFTDSTENPPKKEDKDEEDEKPQRSSVQSQRMPMFPGMDHSTLIAQLRKRQDAESSSESSAQPSKSPKSPLPQGTLGVKLLPTSSDLQDRGAGGSPQWLKELKSKKRLSQYENNS
ncbi:uncharacterized protein KIAA1671 homolog isoform X2 [Pseudophryne corroboree]|uniref:uncharacterized protein KIAA1671 homolog isoform X2 n=1 Tax=Pseudophryne corroboree TaxID=495146 RepID=UPI0030818C46